MIFRVVDGRITEVWNCGYKQGVWREIDAERVLDELGYYLLAGAGGEGPATLMDEARRGEELGFGTAFISERWNVKEASSLVGAACAVTNRMQIATAATNHNTRHPLITGSWATTMHRLSGGRFTLGIGRGIAAMYAAFGIPAGDDRADGGLRAGHAPALARRGDLQPRRADRQVPGAVPRSGLQGGHPAGASSRSVRRRWRWAAGRSTTSSCTPTSRRRRCSGASRP